MASESLPPTGEILLYQTEDGRTRLQVVLDNQTLWLNQKQLMELFGKAKGTISEHIKHIFEDKELEEDSVVRLFRTTGLVGFDRHAIRNTLFQKRNNSPSSAPPQPRAQQNSFKSPKSPPLCAIIAPVTVIYSAKPHYFLHTKKEF